MKKRQLVFAALLSPLIVPILIPCGGRIFLGLPGAGARALGKTDACDYECLYFLVTPLQRCHACVGRFAPRGLRAEL